ncbi:MAG TPA: SBBP repeat-containing protein [Terriglobales bacterium]|nr:SBBP repeat-containing protein [Terriglobales bacterium]
MKLQGLFLLIVFFATLPASAQDTATQPRLDFATYLSGSDNTDITGVAVDSRGYFYVTGFTWASDFPTTAGAFSRIPKQRCDQNGCRTYASFVAKFSRNGSDLVYSTFINEAVPQAIALDEAGNVYLAGERVEDDYVGTSGTLHTKCNNPYGQSCNWIAKLNTNGSAMVYTTLVHDVLHCMNGEKLAVNAKGEVYIAAAVWGHLPCPTTVNAFRKSIIDDGSSVGTMVMKFSADAKSLLYSTYVSSNRPRDIFGGLVVARNDRAIVTGQTQGDLFPTSTNAFQRVPKNGAPTAFVAKLSPDGSALLASTLLGGSDLSQASDIAVDNDLNVYVTGITLSFDFPTTPGAYQREHETGLCFFNSACNDIFLTKLPPDFSQLLYSTYFRLPGDDSPPHLAIDPVGHAYVAGVPPAAFPLFQPIQTETGNMFVAKFSTAGNKLLFSSPLGGPYQFSPYTFNIAVDIAGNAYLGGFTLSHGFATTPDAYQTVSLSEVDSGIAVKVNIPPCLLSNTTMSVTICSPAAGATVKSPVLIAAGATNDHSISAMAIYVDGTKMFTILDNSHFDAKLDMAAGSHKLTVKAWDQLGHIISKSQTVTVQ